MKHACKNNCNEQMIKIMFKRYEKLANENTGSSTIAVTKVEQL